MVQESWFLYNPNGARISLLAYNGAITLSINSGEVSRCCHSTKMYTCEYCTKPFNQKSHLLRHKREVHEWELRFECKKCENNLKENSTSTGISKLAVIARGVIFNSSLTRRTKVTHANQLRKKPESRVKNVLFRCNV